MTIRVADTSLLLRVQRAVEEALPWFDRTAERAKAAHIDDLARREAKVRRQRALYDARIDGIRKK